MRNKKGQEGIGMGTLLALIVGVIAVAMIILYFTGSLKYIFGTQDILPGDLEKVAQSCEFSASQGLITSYCNEFKGLKVGTETKYFNCPELIKVGAVVASAGEMKDKCVESGVNAAVISFCTGKDSSVKVNNKLCSEWQSSGTQAPATQTEKGTCQTKGAVTGGTCGQYNDNKAGCEGAIASGQSCLWAPA